MSEKTYAVRRLTELECLRLQGYPDNWLDLPLKETMTEEEFNEWQEIRKTEAEIEGKNYKPAKTIEQMVKWYNSMITASSHKYKSIGNSIALPFWHQLLGKISEELGEGQHTLGSLFDGLAGFPYVWEMHNGKGSARWASEVAAYPIAVTKYQFKETV